MPLTRLSHLAARDNGRTGVGSTRPRQPARLRDFHPCWRTYSCITRLTGGCVGSFPPSASRGIATMRWFTCRSGRQAREIREAIAKRVGVKSDEALRCNIGELSSTLRIIDEKGGRPDPLRRAALKDALEPQDRIAGRLGKTLRRLALPDGQSPFTDHLGSGSRRQKDHRAGFGGCLTRSCSSGARLSRRTADTATRAPPPRGSPLTHRPPEATKGPAGSRTRSQGRQTARAGSIGHTTTCGGHKFIGGQATRSSVA